MKLQKGINLGGYLSQCVHTKEHYDEFIKEEDIKQIATWGFDHVRLPFDYNVIMTEKAEFKEEGFAFLDKAVAWAEDYNLNIILDLHKACGYDFNDAGCENKNNLFIDIELQETFVSLWKEVSNRYKDCKNVAFELLNEVVEDKNTEAWNRLIERTVTAIRKNAPVTPIIYGGIMWNNAKKLKYLRKPHDENILFTFHFYSPMVFTHQNAYWMPSYKDLKVNYPGPGIDNYKAICESIGGQASDITESTCDKVGVDYMVEIMNEAVAAAKKWNIKVYCGEFGVIDKAPVPDTLGWYKDAVTSFKKLDIGYCCWTYKKMDFGITQEHLQPILKDLIKVLCD